MKHLEIDENGIWASKGVLLPLAKDPEILAMLEVRPVSSEVRKLHMLGRLAHEAVKDAPGKRSPEASNYVLQNDEPEHLIPLELGQVMADSIVFEYGMSLDLARAFDSPEIDEETKITVGTNGAAIASVLKPAYDMLVVSMPPSVRSGVPELGWLMMLKDGETVESVAAEVKQKYPIMANV